jgi:hypothetical protein
MLKHFKLFLILIIILYLPLQSFAQIANPRIEINSTATLQNAQVLYFSNFDIFNVGNAQYLFDVHVYDIVHNPGGINNAQIIFEFYLGDPNTTLPIASATSTEFPVTIQSGPHYQANNIQLINFQQLGNFGINIDFSTDFDPPDDKFEDEFYGSGKARRGMYTLQATLKIGSEIIVRRISIEVTNPSNIQLSSPGNKVGSGVTPEVMTELPVFTFFSDGTEFILYVFEKLSHHNSIEDVINSGNPICFEPLFTPVFNYALTTTGQPLQVGHTYYWYVDVLVPTTAGTEIFRSEVFQFKIIQASGAPAEGTAVTSVIEMLRPIVGNQVDNISKNLTDFELKNIRLNGKPITIYELHQIIDGYEGHLIEVLDLVLY